jgi:AAHS family benzoate transporter-like MFS transporter
VDAGHRRLLWLLGLSVFFEGYGRSLVTVVLPYVGHDLRVPPADLSYAVALTGVGSFGVLVLGPLADRFGRRRLLLVSVLGLSLLGAATALAATLPALVAWQVGARVFQEGALFTAAVIAAEEMPAADRGAAQGLIGTANACGSGFAAFLLAGIDRVPGGWRGLCAVGLAAFAGLPFLRRALPESRRWLAHVGPRLRRPPPAYRGRMLAALVVAFLGMSYDIAGFSFATYVPITVHGWSAAAVSAMFIGAGGVGLPGWWLGGRLADRRGRRLAAVVFLLGLSAAEVAFFLGGSRALWPAFAVMVFCQGGKITVLRSWATELFPTSFRGAAAGWLAAAGTTGGMAGLALAGILAPRLGGIAPALAAIAAAGVAAAAAAYAWLPETRGLELEIVAPEVA